MVDRLLELKKGATKLTTQTGDVVIEIDESIKGKGIHSLEALTLHSVSLACLYNSLLSGFSIHFTVTILTYSNHC